MVNAIQNFQIPVVNFERALKFYNKILGYQLQVMETPEFKLGIFKFDNSSGVGGSIIESKELKPSKTGTMVYLHTGTDMETILSRVNKYGGNIFMEKNQLGPKMGFYSIIEDTEGNRVGLYSTE